MLLVKRRKCVVSHYDLFRFETNLPGRRRTNKAAFQDVVVKSDTRTSHVTTRDSIYILAAVAFQKRLPEPKINISHVTHIYSA